MTSGIEGHKKDKQEHRGASFPTGVSGIGPRNLLQEGPSSGGGSLRHTGRVAHKPAQERNERYDLSDADLVVRAQRGEDEAFAALFDAHKRRVFSICLRMTGHTADAEDLTQEAFLKVFRKISTFRGESTFYTWLYRLTVNEVLAYLRKKRLQHVSLDEGDTSQVEPVTRQYGEDDRRLMGTIDRINMSNAIAHLPPGYRAALVMFDLEGYEHGEIAQIMNSSVGNCKSQLHRARKKLREVFRLHRGIFSPQTR